MPGPNATPALAGVRVLDLSRLIPGPFCTLILADLGASIDKLEDANLGDYLRVFPPLRDGMAGRFNALNRDKRSVCLDLKKPGGREALLRLVAQYDVLVESFRPGVMDRLGVGWEALSAKNPRLVMCSISGYGQTGPLRDRAGHDINYVGLGGVLGLAGPPTAAPPTPPVQLADVAGGALWGAVGILAGLLAARASGVGRHVDVSMCEGALAFMIPDLGNFDADGKPPARGGEMLNGGAAAYGVYATADGRFVSVGALEPKFWAALNAGLGRNSDASELIGSPEQQIRVRAEIAAIMATKTRDEWEAVFADSDACVEPVLAPEELLAHRQHVARQMAITVGEQRHVRTPLGGTGEHRMPPRLGEHSAAILSEAGYSVDEIGRLVAAGVTRTG